MVKNREALDNLEKSIQREESPDFSKNIRLVEAMHKEAVELGAFPPKDKLTGVDVDIKVAKAINSVSKTP